MKTFLFLSLFFSYSAFSLEFKATVLEKGISVPVGEVSIILLPQKIKTISNEKGEFTFSDLPEDFKFEKIIFQKTGFDRLEVDLTESLKAKFYFSRATGLEYETTIVTEEVKDPVLRKIKAKEAVKLPGSAGDAIKAIQNLPGVNRTPGFNSRIAVQGSAPEDTRYSIDGHEVPIMFHFGGLSSVLMPELINEIDFYSAGYGASFGRALGGIINARTIDQASGVNYTHGMAYLDIFNVGAAFETPIGKESHLAVGGRESYVGAVLKKIAEKNEKFNLTVAPSFEDLELSYDTVLNDHLKLKVFSIYSQDKAEFVLKEAIGQDPLLRGSFSNLTQFFRVIPQFVWTHSAISKTRLSLGFGTDKLENIIGSNNFYLNSYVLTTRGENETQVTPTWTRMIGFDHRYTWSDLTFTLPQIYSEGGVINPLSAGATRNADLKGYKSHLLGFYFNNRYKTNLDSRWTFFPGVRIDYFTVVKDFFVLPRLATQYQLSPDLSFTLSSGVVAQPPAEQFSSKNYGNPEISSPKSYHLSLRANKDMSQTWSAGSNYMSGIFAKWMNQLIISDKNTVYSNKGYGRAFGFENSVNYKFNPFSVFGAYTLSRSTRWDEAHTEYLSQYDQTHYLTLIASVDLAKNWRISSRFRYVTGALTTPITSGIFDTDNGVYFPLRGALYSERQGAFSSLDLRVDKRWVYDTWVLSFYLDIQNALNHENIESVQYSYDYQKSVNVAGLPILPTLGLKGEF